VPVVGGAGSPPIGGGVASVAGGAFSVAGEDDVAGSLLVAASAPVALGKGSLDICDGDLFAVGGESFGPVLATLGAVGNEGKGTNAPALAGRLAAPNPSRTLDSTVCTLAGPGSLSPPSSVVTWVSICCITPGRK
jgi:hypothetical protein